MADALPERDERILKPRPWKWLLVILVSIAFVAIGVAVIGGGDWWGWLAAAFFALCGGVGVAGLLPGASHLRLTGDGFAIRSLYRTRFICWDAVENIKVGEIGRAKGVTFDFVASQTAAHDLTAIVKGGHDGLPDTYGMKADALADLMNQWRARAVGGGD